MVRGCLAAALAQLFLLMPEARAEVTQPLPGVTMVRRPGAAMTITNLCAPGISVRATKYAERRATPQAWAQSIGAQVAINADFFDFPGWSWVLVRARGDGEEWPPEAEKLLQPSSYWEFGPGMADFELNSLVTPPWYVSQVVGAYDIVIEGGKPHNFTPDQTFMLASYRRSAIGLSEDRATLFFYASNAAINGPGMAAEMMSMAAEAGAPPIYVASNEDGGGSSQLYVQGLGQVIDSGRQVNTHLGVYASGAGAPQNCPLTRSRASSNNVASWDANRVDLLLPGKDRSAQHRWWDGATWSSWELLPMTSSSIPRLTSWGPGRLDGFAREDDGSVGHLYFDGQWHQDNLGGQVIAPPVATSWGPGRLDVFGIATDGTLLHQFWPAGDTWGSDNLGGEVAYPPAVTAWSANRLDIIAVNPQGGVGHLAWNGLAWSAWEGIGQGAVSAVNAVSWAPYRLDAFALAEDHSVLHWFWQDAWGQDSLGGQLASAPVAVTWGRNRLDVFGIGNDGTLQHAFWDGVSWSSWESLGGTLDARYAPTPISRTPNQIDIFAVGTDLDVQHIAWNGATWIPWESLGGEMESAPEGGGSDDSQIVGGCAVKGSGRVPWSGLALSLLAIAFTRQRQCQLMG